MATIWVGVLDPSGATAGVGWAPHAVANVRVTRAAVNWRIVMFIDSYFQLEKSLSIKFDDHNLVLLQHEARDRNLEH